MFLFISGLSVASLLLQNRKIKVLRFDNLEMLQNTDGVLELIYETVRQRTEIPPLRDPLLKSVRKKEPSIRLFIKDMYCPHPA